MTKASAHRGAAGQPSLTNSRAVADSDSQSPARARPSTNPAASRKLHNLKPEAKSRSSVMDLEMFTPSSIRSQSASRLVVPSIVQKTLFQYEGPSPTLLPA